ncbi:hypothetical protein [uncultured Jannaschia sp.]|uniref:hypothetical protein n=1 Tax=uncultured Jannaschia sp. TaxID=293347 RepID=UPI00261B1670|nr:hypothetical protein [uncultured Jannaschia sp.]
MAEAFNEPGGVTVDENDGSGHCSRVQATKGAGISAPLSRRPTMRLFAGRDTLRRFLREMTE